MADMKQTEIELTFLAREIPKEIAGVKPDRLIDAYLPEDSTATMRLRKKGSKFEFTKKVPLKPGDLSAHIEQTIMLDETEFEALRKAGGQTVEKDRYMVKIDGYAAEVDVFLGDLAGLVMIDFEFPDVAAKQNFRPPKCCLADVTQELFVAGGQLAGKTYADIAKKLKTFAYTPLSS
jgi:adenylate cyclase